MPHLPRSSPARRLPPWLPLLAAATLAGGCGSDLDRIDQSVDSLLIETSEDMSARPPGQTITDLHRDAELAPVRNDPTAKTVPTTNPPASALQFTPLDEAADVLRRLDAYAATPEDAMQLDLSASLAYARRHSREYLFAEEDYVLTALRLLGERHLFGPRFFSETSAIVTGDGDDGLFDTSLELLSELGVTQRLEQGGVVTARAIARATEDLHQRVAGENVQSAEILLTADIPLLRGAGTVASESLIQAERDMIYAARDYERFTRQFLFDVTADFLGLVVQQRQIENGRDRVESLRLEQDRQRARYEAGRIRRDEAAIAEQATVFAIDTLNSQLEGYRLAVDRFKVLLTIPTETPVVIVPEDVGLPVPDVPLDDAVRVAMQYRLDLQTERDQLDDARRRVDNARNDLLPDLDLIGSLSIPTDPDKNRAGVDFEPKDLSFQAGVNLGLPLDRELERLALRTAQIGYERARRDYEEFRDDIAVRVRAAVRGIDRALFSFQIQEQNVLIAEQRKASIDAQPDRVNARDSTESLDDLNRALDDREDAGRDLQLAILLYLLETGQLRVERDGTIEPLSGMGLARGERPTRPAPGPAGPPPAAGPEKSPPAPWVDEYH
ncbi:MAG: TolC family protein [Planctomycetota bacterium]|jgi:outer membrane protein TolC